MNKGKTRNKGKTETSLKLFADLRLAGKRAIENQQKSKRTVSEVRVISKQESKENSALQEQRGKQGGGNREKLD